MEEEEAAAEGQEQNQGGQAEGGRNVKPRSAVWEHFTLFTADDRTSKARCNRCRAELKASTKYGTSHLHRHVHSHLRRHVHGCSSRAPAAPSDPNIVEEASGTGNIFYLLPLQLQNSPTPSFVNGVSTPQLEQTEQQIAILLQQNDLPSDPDHPMFPCDPTPPSLPSTSTDTPPPQVPSTDPPQPLSSTMVRDIELLDRDEHGNGEGDGEGQASKHHLARLIALRGHDPSIVEDDCFRSFVESLKPGFRLPSRLAIEEMCDGIFDEARTDLLSRLNRSHGRVSLSVATADTMDGKFLYTACHFIDDEWKLHKVVLDAYHVKAAPVFYGPLLGIPEVTLNSDCFKWAINDVVDGISKRGIFDRLFVVAWEFGGMDVDEEMQHYMTQRFSMPTELTDTIISKMLTEDQVTCIMLMDRSFHFIAELLKPPKDFATKVFHAMDGLDFTRQERQQLFSEMRLEHPRAHGNLWYSLYCSLKFLMKHGPSAIADTASTELAEAFCKVWDALYHGIQRISASSCPTANLCLVELFKVLEVLQSKPARVTAGGKEVADALARGKGVLEMLIQLGCRGRRGWSVPLILDPRYKVTYIKIAFNKAFGSSKVSARSIFKATREIKDLFANYIKYDDGINNGEDSDHLTPTVATNGGESGPLEEASHGGEDFDTIGIATGSGTDSIEQSWDEHCRSRGRRTDGSSSSYLDAEKELDCYLEDDLVPQTEDFDILKWWKEHSSEYPTVALMARDALTMPTCSKLSSEHMAHVRSIVRGYSKKKYSQIK